MIRAIFGERGIRSFDVTERTRLQMKAYGERLRAAGKSLGGSRQRPRENPRRAGLHGEWAARQRDVSSFLLIEEFIVPLCAAGDCECQGLCREEPESFLGGARRWCQRRAHRPHPRWARAAARIA